MRKKKILAEAMLLFAAVSIMACSVDKNNGEITGNLLPNMSKDEMKLTYQIWDDGLISEVLYEEWTKKYPNISINFQKVLKSENNEKLVNSKGTSDMPDVFWVSGLSDFVAEKEILNDMTTFWNADSDSSDIIGGINDYKLGYFGTDNKLLTVVQFDPATAWLDIGMMAEYSTGMPDLDWTFEDMVFYIENFSHEGSRWGVSNTDMVISWYPIASGKDCIGDFGWNGSEFQLSAWAEGMRIVQEWKDNEYIAPDVLGETGNYDDELAERNVLETGKVFIRFDNWSEWENYLGTDVMYRNNEFSQTVVWVPYMLPHLEKNADSTVYLADMIFGGISSECEYSREAYEILKYFCWGSEGWHQKIAKQDEIMAGGISPLGSCPVTLDETVWEEFENMYPSVVNGDKEGMEYGFDRSEYFTYYFKKVKCSKWVCCEET